MHYQPCVFPAFAVQITTLNFKFKLWRQISVFCPEPWGYTTHSAEWSKQNGKAKSDCKYSHITNINMGQEFMFFAESKCIQCFGYKDRQRKKSTANILASDTVNYISTVFRGYPTSCINTLCTSSLRLNSTNSVRILSEVVYLQDL